MKMNAYALRIWRSLPVWVHLLGARVFRSRFRVAVAALIFDERGRILLFKHTYRKFEWGIPAGSLEYHEQPAEAIVREFHEETGIQVAIEKLLKVVSAREDHHLTVVYLCKPVTGEFKPSHEISEMKYFELDSLPPMLFTEKDLIRWAAGSLTTDC
jgi:ADP-ribose pyrophosphatase YjhB (NUDIX family)